MELQTIVKLEKPSFHIDYTTRIMLLGSCFVENVGAKLEYFRFKTEINPCGIVYNPLSVANTLNFLLGEKKFNESDLLENAGKWVSLSHHGRFSATRAEDCLKNINTRLQQACTFLQSADVLIITWGTAWAYRYLKNGSIVANCHKFPAADFERFRLTVEEITMAYADIVTRLRELRPSLKVLFTVSPIRHWKDGAHGNQLSKAVLLLAIDRLRERFDFVSYFPSYEIVMDELRDYRFYAPDMLHISPQGIDYIWEKFRDTYMEKNTRMAMDKMGQINKVLQHRPINPDSGEYQKLLHKTTSELQELSQQLGLASD